MITLAIAASGTTIAITWAAAIRMLLRPAITDQETAGMNTTQISRRVDELTAAGMPAGQAIAQAVTEAHTAGQIS